jgi:hypothetical protein
MATFILSSGNIASLSTTTNCTNAGHLNRFDAATITANANFQGFFLQNNTPGLPEIWIMAIIVAALDAWASPVPIGHVEQHTHLVLTEVFQNLLGRLLGPGSFVEGGVRAKPLSADISFWRIYAQDRGLDVAMGSLIQSWLPFSSLGPFSGTTRNYILEMPEIIQLLTSLLKPSNPSNHASLSLSSRAVYEVAKLLREIGLKIKTAAGSPYLVEGCDSAKLTVYLANNSTDNDLPQHAGSSAKATAETHSELLMCLMDAPIDEGSKLGPELDCTEPYCFEIRHSTKQNTRVRTRGRSHELPLLLEGRV